MKALSRKKRGRPKNETAARTDSGQISRARNPPNKLALEVRARMHRISLTQAVEPDCVDWLGRLHMAYIGWNKNQNGPRPEFSISTAQYHALLSYQTLRNDYLKATGSPGAYYETPEGLTSARDDDERARWEKSVKERMKAVRDAIQDEQNESRMNLWAALDICVLQGQEMPHMLGEVRVLGNVLARCFGPKGRA